MLIDDDDAMQAMLDVKVDHLEISNIDLYLEIETTLSDPINPSHSPHVHNVVLPTCA